MQGSQAKNRVQKAIICGEEVIICGQEAIICGFGYETWESLPCFRLKNQYEWVNKKSCQVLKT